MSRGPAVLLSDEAIDQRLTELLGARVQLDARIARLVAVRIDRETKGQRHGVPGYRRGCRCHTCKRAKADEMNSYRARKATAKGATDE